LSVLFRVVDVVFDGVDHFGLFRNQSGHVYKKLIELLQTLLYLDNFFVFILRSQNQPIQL
jgi:hypothetical protein